MKLDELRSELEREQPKPKKLPVREPWRGEVRNVIRQRPHSLTRSPCPECGGKRRQVARLSVRGDMGALVEVQCSKCAILWRVSRYACRVCAHAPVSAYDRVCADCMPNRWRDLGT